MNTNGCLLIILIFFQTHNTTILMCIRDWALKIVLLTYRNRLSETVDLTVVTYSSVRFRSQLRESVKVQQNGKSGRFFTLSLTFLILALILPIKRVFQIFFLLFSLLLPCYYKFLRDFGLLVKTDEIKIFYNQIPPKLSLLTALVSFVILQIDGMFCIYRSYIKLLIKAAKPCYIR